MFSCLSPKKRDKTSTKIKEIDLTQGKATLQNQDCKFEIDLTSSNEFQSTQKNSKNSKK